MSDERLTVEFLGERFAVAEKLGILPMMRFAKIARGGVDSSEMAGLAAMYDLLEQSIAADEWQRFNDHADRRHADSEELMQVVADVVAIHSGRPTSRPSDSSDGSPSTSVQSVGVSSSQVIAALEAAGRPDLALFVTQARDASV